MTLKFLEAKAVKLLYWGIVLASFAAVTIMLFTYTPVEKTMGQIQKIFYLHLPSAICAFLACLVSFVGAVGYLGKRQMAWDDLSAGGAKVAALMCTVVLITGMIWARSAWNTWWEWTPRLTFSLLLWLLYVVYLIVRSSIESRSRRATICAVYAVAAFLDVPLVYLSVRLMNDLHPKTAELMTTSMKLTLAAWFVPVTLLTAGLIVLAKNAYRREREQNARQVVEDASWSVPERPEQTP